MLVLLSVFVCFVVGTTARTGSVFSQANIFVWPVLLCFTIGFVLGLQRAYVLFVKKVYVANEARRGLSTVLGMSAAQFALGVAGVWLGLFPLSRAVIGNPETTGVAIMGWMFGGTALMLVSLGGCVVIALWWLVLVSRAAAIEEEEAYTLLHISGAREEN